MKLTNEIGLTEDERKKLLKSLGTKVKKYSNNASSEELSFSIAGKDVSGKFMRNATEFLITKIVEEEVIDLKTVKELNKEVVALFVDAGKIKKSGNWLELSDGRRFNGSTKLIAESKKDKTILELLKK